MAKSDPLNTGRLWDVSPWKYLFSLRVGIVFLLALAVASVAGTLIVPLPRAQAVVYYSWWYRALLLAVGVNLSCATIRTIFLKLLPSSPARFMRQRAFYRNASPSAELPCGADASLAAEVFRREGFKTSVSAECGHAWKGRLGRWGAPVSHLGFLMILLGGFASAWTAREGTVTLPEGGAADSMALPGHTHQDQPLGFIIQCDDFETAVFPRTNIPSKFVTTATIYENGMPVKSGQIEVNASMHVHGWSIHQSGRQEEPQLQRFLLGARRRDAATTQTIEISPGQSRMLPGSTDAAIELSDSFPWQWTIHAADGKHFDGALDGTAPNLRLRAVRFEPDFKIGADKQVYSPTDKLDNPALQIALLDGERRVSEQWLFERADLKAMTHQAEGPYTLDLAGVQGDAPDYRFDIVAAPANGGAPARRLTLRLGESADLGAPPAQTPVAENAGEWTVRLLESRTGYLTTLTLTRNPAIPLIYFGCAVAMAGLLLSFFIPRKEVWFLAERREGKLFVAAAYRHPREGFDPNTQRVLDQLRTAECEAPGRGESRRKSAI